MRGDMIETYELVSVLEDVYSSQFFTRSSMNNLREHSLELHKEHFRKVIQKEFSKSDRSMELAARGGCNSKNVV